MASPNVRAPLSDSSHRAPANGEKRKRKSYSCYECRRRKLKCDRGYPSCTRCQKAGHEARCSYDVPPLPDRPSEPSAALATPTRTPRTPPRQVHRARIDATANRFSNLEADQNPGTWQLLSQWPTGKGPSEQRPAVKADAEEPFVRPQAHHAIHTVLFRGENFRTQYHGGSNSTSLIGHFPELRLFMKETIEHQTSLYRVQLDLKALQTKWKSGKTGVLSGLHLDFAYLLPDQETIDKLVRLYFDTFESTYRIIHAPSFWAEYSKLAEDRQSVRPAFVIILLLVMACVSCVSRKEQIRYIGDSSVPRERAIAWIEASETWLRCHSQKNIYLAIWQIRCLLVLAKQVNTVKKKRLWTEAGTLVREAMAAGFHRDPSMLGERASLFDREMRRRLWATMTELELQASVDRGMASVLAGIFTDTKTVLNIEDEDLCDEPESLEKAKPVDHYTSSSFLQLSHASFPLRVALTSVVNDLGSPLRYEEVLIYEEMVNKELQKLPRRTDVSQQGNLSLVAQILLDVQLRQFLIMLHGPFARQAEQSPRHSLSRIACFDAAASIIDHYMRLSELGDYALLLLRHDYFRAALVICQNSYISASLQNDLLLTSNMKIFLQYIDNALTLLEDRIVQLGTSYTHYWYTSASCALLKSEVYPEQSALENQQAIDRVARQYYRVLASQEDMEHAKEDILAASKNAMNTPHGQVLPSGHTLNGTGESFPESTAMNSMFEQTNSLDEAFFGNPEVWVFDSLYSMDYA